MGEKEGRQNPIPQEITVNVQALFPVSLHCHSVLFLSFRQTKSFGETEGAILSTLNRAVFLALVFISSHTPAEEYSISLLFVYQAHQRSAASEAKCYKMVHAFKNIWLSQIRILKNKISVFCFHGSFVTNPYFLKEAHMYAHVLEHCMMCLAKVTLNRQQSIFRCSVPKIKRMTTSLLNLIKR